MADIYSHLIFSRTLLRLQVLSPVLLYDSQKILLHLVQDEIFNQSQFHAGRFEGNTEIQSPMCRTQFLNKESSVGPSPWGEREGLGGQECPDESGLRYGQGRKRIEIFEGFGKRYCR